MLDDLNSDPRSARFAKLNAAMVELIDQYGLVGFETLAVEDKTSMMRLLRIVDKAVGYAGPGVSGDGWLGDVEDVQDRWGDGKSEWDEAEREVWREEGAERATREMERLEAEGREDQ